MIHRDLRNRHGTGSCGQHDGFGRQGLAGAVDGFQLYFVGRKESRASVPVGHAVACELTGHITLMRFHDFVEAMQEDAHRDIEAHFAFENLVRSFQAFELHRRLAQGLAGDRAPIDAVAADTRFLLDQHDLLPGLGSLDGCLLACRSAADHDNVIDACGHHNGIASTTAWTLSLWAKSASMSFA